MSVRDTAPRTRGNLPECCLVWFWKGHGSLSSPVTQSLLGSIQEESTNDFEKKETHKASACTRAAHWCRPSKHEALSPFPQRHGQRLGCNTVYRPFFNIICDSLCSIFSWLILFVCLLSWSSGDRITQLRMLTPPPRC